MSKCKKDENGIDEKDELDPKDPEMSLESDANDIVDESIIDDESEDSKDMVIEIDEEDLIFDKFLTSRSKNKWDKGM